MHRIAIIAAVCFCFCFVVNADETLSWKGNLVDTDGKPIVDATVCIGGNRKLVAETKTDAEGKFLLTSPKKAGLQFLYAFKKGAGFDFVRIKDEDNPEDSYTLTFKGINPIRIRFVDQDDKPLAGRKLDSWLILNDKKETFNTAEINERRFVVKSDEEGCVHFDCLPAGRFIVFMLDWENEKGFLNDPYWYPDRDIAYDPNKPRDEIVIKMAPAVRISGKVQFDDGRPASGLRMSLFGRGFMPCEIPCNPGRTRADFERLGCSTGKDGRYSMTLYGDMLYVFGPLSKQIDGKWYGAAPKRDIVSKVGTTLGNNDFVFKPFTKVAGRLLKADGSPSAKTSLVFFRYGVRSDELPPEKQLENKAAVDGFVHHAFRNMFQPAETVVTNEEGRFEVLLPPGRLTAVYSMPGNRDEGWSDLRTEKTAVEPLFEFVLDGEETKDLGEIKLPKLD